MIALKPLVIPHSSYQSFVLDQLKSHYQGGVLTLISRDWPLIAKLWIADLSAMTVTLRPYYDDKGPYPRDPASMLRSYLLFLIARPEIGITAWVDEMHRVPLYAILSGFKPHNIPGVGTFYDFFARLWTTCSHHLKSTHQARRRRKRRRGKKGEKAPTTTPGRIKRLVDWVICHMAKKSKQPFDQLYDFFQSHILAKSAQLGLLGDCSALCIAGDGTPVVTAVYPRSKPSCDCHAQGLAKCDHPRIYSQPDCDSGWDSARERYFNGYHLYMLTAANSPHDLPLYPRLQPASRHDAVSFVISAFEFSQRFTLGKVSSMLLDAAHDAEPIYALIVHQNIEPFIDLNIRGKNNSPTSTTDIQLSPEGTPICKAGLKMKPNGYDHTKYRQKWRCPLASGTTITCSTPCSDAKYGRTFHTYSSGNLRLCSPTPRESDKWKITYKRRTTVERSNKREKIDYKLEAGRHRSTMMWYMRLYNIMICQHIDAWFATQQKDEVLQNLQSYLYPSVA